MKEEVEDKEGSTVVVQNKVTKRSKLGHQNQGPSTSIS
jgi:hypothetical protein